MGRITSFKGHLLPPSGPQVMMMMTLKHVQSNCHPYPEGSLAPTWQGGMVPGLWQETYPRVADLFGQIARKTDELCQRAERTTKKFLHRVNLQYAEYLKRLSAINQSVGAC